MWAATKGKDWERSPDRLRHALTQRELDPRSPLVLFVGLQVYEQAGGRVRHDLFGDPNAGYVVDVELLQRLATEKMDKAAEPVRREGWGWVDVRLDVFTDSYNFSRAAKGRRPLTDDEQAEIEALEVAIDEADKALDAFYAGDDEADEEDPKRPRWARGTTSRGRSCASFEAKYGAWTPEVRAHAGAVVALDRNGKVSIHRALVRPQDRKAVARAAAPKQRGGHQEQGEAREPKAAESESLTRRLTAHRPIA